MTVLCSVLFKYLGHSSTVRNVSVTAEEEAARNWFSKRELSDPEVLKKAYRNLVKQYHPDAGGNTASMQEIVKAYQGGASCATGTATGGASYVPQSLNEKRLIPTASEWPAVSSG